MTQATKVQSPNIGPYSLAKSQLAPSAIDITSIILSRERILFPCQGQNERTLHLALQNDMTLSLSRRRLLGLCSVTRGTHIHGNHRSANFDSCLQAYFSLLVNCSCQKVRMHHEYRAGESLNGGICRKGQQTATFQKSQPLRAVCT